MNKYLKLAMLAGLMTQVVSAGNDFIAPNVFDLKIRALESMITESRTYGKSSNVIDEMERELAGLKEAREMVQAVALREEATSPAGKQRIQQELKAIRVLFENNRNALRAIEAAAQVVVATPAQVMPAPVAQVALEAPYENSGYFGEQNEQTVTAPAQAPAKPSRFPKPSTAVIASENMTTACKKALAGLGFAGLVVAGLVVSTYLDMAAVQPVIPFGPNPCVGEECVKTALDPVVLSTTEWAMNGLKNVASKGLCLSGYFGFCA
jgi:hypothetical protein